MINKEVFGIIDNQKVFKYTIENERLKVVVTDFGANIISIIYKGVDVVLGCDELSGYINNDGNMGSFVGPSANRIANGQFELDGITYNLLKNNKGNNLHTDPLLNTNKKLMQSEIVGDSIEFSCVIPDMEAGLPGNRKIKCKYELIGNRLEITYSIFSDKKTIFNPTNHSYFNLNGHNSGTVLNHKLKLNSDSMTISDEKLIPTGEIVSVKNTPFDFTKYKEIGKDINQNDVQLINGSGYDHNFVINNFDGSLRKAGELIGDKTKIKMICYTTCPGIQIYTANFLNRKDGKDNSIYLPKQSICLETQFYPDNVNKDNFPKCIVEKDSLRELITIYEFNG